MSTYYRPKKKLKLKDVKSINHFNINKGDGHNYLIEFQGHYLHIDVCKGNIIDFFRYGSNDAYLILDEITHHLGVNFVDEHDDDYDDYAEDGTNVFEIRFDKETIH